MCRRCVGAKNVTAKRAEGSAERGLVCALYFPFCLNPILRMGSLGGFNNSFK
jgi:hypothetical protein